MAWLCRKEPFGPKLSRPPKPELHNGVIIGLCPFSVSGLPRRWCPGRIFGQSAGNSVTDSEPLRVRADEIARRWPHHFVPLSPNRGSMATLFRRPAP